MLKKIREHKADIVGGIGMVMWIVGAAAGESDNLMIPAVLVIVGLLMCLVASKEMKLD